MQEMVKNDIKALYVLFLAPDELFSRWQTSSIFNLKAME